MPDKSSDLIDVRGPLDKLAAGEVTSASWVTIPNSEAKLRLRYMIQKTADGMGLAIVIRDDTDPWLPIAANHLMVMRLSDYTDAAMEVHYASLKVGDLVLMWIVGESDDHLEAAFTSAAAAEAYLAKIRERDGTKPDRDHWWIAEIPCNPGAPFPRSPLQGLGGLG